MTRRLLASTALAVAALLGLGACSSSPSLADAPAAASAPAAGSELEPAAFASALKRPGTVVLDVRTPAEFSAGHLKGAVNIDIENPDFGPRLATLNPTTPYAVYCRSGNRSAAAVAAMKTAGFTQMYHLGGGIGAWQSAGGEVTTS